MAAQIISMLNEGGYDSLYARNLFLSHASYPWRASIAPSPQTGHRFADLEMSFKGNTPAHIRDANGQLLVIFTDIISGRPMMRPTPAEPQDGKSP